MSRLVFLLVLAMLWAGTKISHSDEDWRELLGRERYCVMRRKATERAFSYSKEIQEGIYCCAACELPLFNTRAKCEGMFAWPTFHEPIEQIHIWIKEDYSLPFRRYEILCRQCDSHLGHVFRNAETKELRYVVNSIALILRDMDP